MSIILILVLMEGLLSADNALVLATMANKIKDPEKRKKALYYGMVGAVAFRIFFICIGVWMIKLWALKLVGALYLAKLAYDHFSKKEEDADNDGIIDKFQQTPLHKLLGKFGITLTTFWSVVISIEIMDLAFSVDSILAALALSDKFWVLALGGILGIAMMRGVAGFFMKLIERVPEMEHTAFVLIGIIALKMFLGTIHNLVDTYTWISQKLFNGAIGVYHIHEIHIPHLLFFGILVITFGATFVINKINVKKGKHTQVSK
ncbi:TerC family protein [Priestia megaterium]|uniref:TerC family protein n=1 Tax=Priestia megaterium TaxID=1404 RepID=UPI002877D8E9|nr:hypothetical protein [Priestia megaterium]